MDTHLIDHLFRHHAGKMVSVLTRIFGLSNLEIIEDAVQDTFLKASKTWPQQEPENPEAWLTQVAKNRVFDIFRSIKSAKNKHHEFKNGIDTIAIHELFLDSEIEDAQLRMIFTACHPKLDPRDRISFALKIIAGFSTKEIASALLTKEETIKKRIQRARKTIQRSTISFTIPQGKELPKRIESVLEVLYLIFNEGFHSNKKDVLVSKELCGEAMRMCQYLLKNKHTNIPASYALFALMCFHAARLEAKINSKNELLDLKSQDRNTWSFPLIQLGNMMMNTAVKENDFSIYHYEAAIAAEHIKAPSYLQTNWDKILQWHEQLHKLNPTPAHLLSMAIVCLQNKNYLKFRHYLEQITPEDLAQRSYLYYATKADYYAEMNNQKEGLKQLDIAIATTHNNLEKEYLLKKRAQRTT